MATVLSFQAKIENCVNFQSLTAEQQNTISQATIIEFDCFGAPYIYGRVGMKATFCHIINFLSEGKFEIIA
jgi:hypothetical protein